VFGGVGDLLVGVAVVVLLTLVFFWPVVAGKTLSNIPSAQRAFAPWQGVGKPTRPYLQTDQATYVYPLTVLETRAWRTGSIPMWNPYNLGGNPLLANGQAGVLYPPRILLALTTSPTVDHDLFVILHLFASGLFTLLFLKELRFRLWSGLLGAAGWMFASWNTIVMQTETVLPVIALLPLALLLIHRAGRTRSWRTAALAGVPLGLMALGGQLELVAIAFVVCALYAGALALGDSRPERRGARRLVDPLLTIGVGTGLGAAALVPTLRNASQGARQPVSYAAFAASHTISTGQFRHVFSSGVPDVRVNVFGTGVYLGLAVILLAFVGVLVRRPGTALGRWLAVGTFLFAIGAPIVAWPAYHLIPGVSRLDSTGYVLWLFDFGILILAAAGLDALLDWSNRQERRSAVPARHGLASIPTAATLVAVVAITATAWQLVDYGRSINPPFVTRRGASFYPVTPAIRALDQDRRLRARSEPQRLVGFNAVFGDTSIVIGAEDGGGYDSVVPARVRDLWRLVGGIPGPAIHKLGRLSPFKFSGSYYTYFFPTPTRYALLPRLGVTTLVADPASARQLQAQPRLTAPLVLRPIYSGGDASVFDIAGSQPRAWVVHQADVVANPGQALQRFASTSFDYRNRMLVEPDQRLGAAGRASRRGSEPGVVAARESISVNETTYSVDSASAGWLVMADAWAPGWQATVNGRAAFVRRADYAFRAVAVPAGRSHVVLRYRSPGLVLGLVVSGVTVLGLFVLVAVSLPSRRRARATAREH